MSDRIFGLFLIGFFVGASVSAVRAEGGPEILFERTKAGEWRAELSLAADESALLFTRSRGDWRRSSWIIETPGARLERSGHYDVLVGEGGGLPQKISIMIKPHSAILPQEYTPMVALADGAMAVFTGQFEVAPIPESSAALEVPEDLNESRIEALPVSIRFRDASGGRILLLGARHEAEVDWHLEKHHSYAVYGATSVVETPELLAIINDGMPDWMRKDILTFLPRLGDFYQERFGIELRNRPTVIVGWAGPTPGFIPRPAASSVT